MGFFSGKKETKEMPWKSKVPCHHQGCPRLVEVNERYCEEHAPLHKESVRPSRANGAWYCTKRWQILRKNVLAEEPFCRECMKQGFAVQATDVDHIISHKGNPELFWDRTNLQALCHSCHSKKTAKEDRQPEYS